MKNALFLLPLLPWPLIGLSCSSDGNEPGTNVVGTGGSSGTALDASIDGMAGTGLGGMAGLGGGAGTAGAAGGVAGHGASAGTGGIDGGQGGMGGTDAGPAGAGGTDGDGGLAGMGGESGKDSGAAGSAGSGGTTNCVVVSAKGFIGSDFPVAGVSARVTPNLGSSTQDLLFIDLWEEDSFLQAPGQFDLSLETDNQTCNHCVTVYQDSPDGSFAKKYFFQVSGTLELIEVSSPPFGQTQGVLTNVRLVEVDDGFSPIPNGGCLLIESLGWNTVPPAADAGTPCKVASDCGGTAHFVCDPTTSSCQPYQCDYPPNKILCGSDEICLPQVNTASVGACYKSCVPFGAPDCPDGYSCRPLTDLLVDGACYAIGSGSPDGTCSPSDSDINTGCPKNYTCQSELSEKLCREQCDYFGPAPRCTSQGQFCEVGGLCTAGKGNDVPIGALCTESADANCAPVGESYRGRCVNGGNDAGMICAQVCRLGVAADCPAGKTCKKKWWSDNMGLCL